MLVKLIADFSFNLFIKQVAYVINWMINRSIELLMNLKQWKFY